MRVKVYDRLGASGGCEVAVTDRTRLHIFWNLMTYDMEKAISKSESDPD